MKNSKQLARDVFDTFTAHMPALLMSSQIQTAEPKKAALTDDISRLSKIDFEKTG